MIPGGQYQNGSLAAPRAQLIDHLESRHARQTDVQDDQAAGFRFGQEKRRLAVLGTVGCVAGAFEKRDDPARKRWIILDKQDSSRGSLPLFIRSAAASIFLLDGS
jgi:hypothetical protein